ncbi:MAG: hypothetical protein J5545_07295 [Bacteroidaceae bacterium]|nr:hypothetical protein [Bacteroidaceae bacterium]
MKKYIEITDEVLARLNDGKCVEGSLRVDPTTKKIVFRHYNRLPRRRPQDRLICELEHGWLKESAQRYKFYDSVPKTLGARRTANAMRRELQEAMEALDVDEMMESFFGENINSHNTN